MNTLEKTYFTMHKISNIISKLLWAIIVGLVIVNLGTVLLQVVNRYIIVKISDISFSWTDELARFSMIWVCYTALPLCYREGSMAQLDLIFDRAGKKGRMFLYLMTRVLVIIFLVIAIYFGFYVVETRLTYKSSMLRAPGIALYTAPILGCILTGFEVLTELIGILSGTLVPFCAGDKRGFPEHEEPGASLSKSKEGEA